MMQTSLQPRAYKAFIPPLPKGMVTLVPAQKESSNSLPEMYVDNFGGELMNASFDPSASDEASGIAFDSQQKSDEFIAYMNNHPDEDPVLVADMINRSGKMGTIIRGDENAEIPDLTIKGFDSERYNQHDELIVNIVDDLNSNKSERFGLTNEQVKQVPDIDPLLIKSWMIQESGGSDSRSKAAWLKDPLQVNVPGIDWSPLKESLGLNEPTVRNTGDLGTNVEAGIIWMVRKGYGFSAVAPKDITNRPNPTFDGFFDAIRRYNGRTDLTASGKSYSVEYAERIFDRYNTPDEIVKISIKKGD